MKINNYEVSHTSYSIINERQQVIGNRTARNFFKLKELLKSCDIGTSTVMIKKNLINNDVKFAPLKTKEDFVLWLKLLKKNIKIYGLNETLTFWNKSKSSLLIFLCSVNKVFFIQSINPFQNFDPTKIIGNLSALYVCTNVTASKNSSNVPKPPGITTKP